MSARVPPYLVVGGAAVATSVAVAGLELVRPKVPVSPGRAIRGGRVHVRARIGPRPTIVLESGLGIPLSLWNWIFGDLDRIADRCSVVAYDRPGIGWSGRPLGGTVAPSEYPAHLLDVLHGVAAPGPLILVGHSVGGLLTRMFAAQYPDLVAGLVFVDSAHPEQYRRSSRQAAGLPVMQNELDRMIWRATFRRPVEDRLDTSYGNLPADLVVPAKMVRSMPGPLRATRRELDHSLTTWGHEAARLTAFAGPVAVVTAGASREADPAFAELADDLAGLSPDSRSFVAPDADHHTLLTHSSHAVHVASAIRWVLVQHLRRLLHPTTMEGTRP